MNFFIKKSWNNNDLNHDPVEVSLARADDSNLEVRIRAPYFNSPPKPDQEPGVFFNLWDYEVVEAFFLADSNHYIELEFGPYGHYIVILFDRERHSIKEGLKLDFSAQIDHENKIWTGRALIPESYLPCQVTKWNAYAINRDSIERSYEALYPIQTPNLFNNPDFHRLSYFSNICFEQLLPSNHERNTESEIWKSSFVEITNKTRD